MNTEMLRAFLDDCKDRPLDPVPRLILADWLEDHARSPAELNRARALRLAAQVMQDFPEGVATSAYWNYAMTPEYAETPWFSDCPEMTPHLFEDARGLYAVHRDASSLLTPEMERLASSPEWDWVESLLLSGNADLVARVCAGPVVERIGQLRLETVPPPRLWTGPWGKAELPRLRSFSCRMPSSSIALPRGAPTWSALPQLHEFSLEFTSEIGSFATWPLENLLRLDMTCGYARGLGQLLRSPHLGCVRELRLKLHTLDPHDFKHLNGTPLAGSLQRLVTDHTALGDSGGIALAGCDLPQLRWLHLPKARLGAKGLRALTRAPWLPQLESLDLSQNTMGPSELPGLLHAPLTALRHLDLSGIRLSPQTWDALTSSPTLQRVEVLNLRGTKAGEAGLRALASWQGLASLELLILDASDYTLAGLETLLESPHRSQKTRFLAWGELISQSLEERMKALTGEGVRP